MTQKLATFDLSGLKTNFLLNKGVFTTTEIDYFRNKPRNKQGQVVMNTSAEEWQNLYERVIGADLRTGGRIADFQQLAEKDRLKQTSNNVIPIGILNLDATLLTDAQVDENAKQKSAKQKPNADKYEKLSIVLASVLQEDIYQANVQFRLSPALVQGSSKNQIKRVEIDFQDGKGFRSYSLNEQLIDYRFEAIGERNIAIRLLTERGVYLFYSKLNIRQLDRPKVFREFQVSAEVISQDTIAKKIVKGGREAAISVSGGNVRVLLSCDQVFDKPIIIAEGFDIGQDIGLDEMVAKYRAPLQFLIDRGYDLVLLDYWDARTFMENNAQVLKRLIREVNNTKSGNERLVVIGESMSGLVARWALREMENAGENHQVRLYISFDSPHQGANVPVSIINLYYELNATLLVNVFYPILPKGWRNLYEALQTPAAAQLLLHQRGRNFPPVGSAHPLFQEFRNRLQALGNNGYPQQCRNIAITNGSADGSDRALFANYNYGSNIITSTTPYILQNTYVEAYTNNINQNSLNLNFAAFGLLFNGLANINYNSPFNDDFLPGGLSDFAVPNRISNPTRNFRFCFVPTFSAIDFQGDRSSQNPREFLNVNTPQRPFAAVYTNLDPNNNFNHVSARAANWGAIATNEGLTGPNVTCQGPPIPINPYFYSNQPSQTCFTPTQSVTYTVAPTGDLNAYTHQWVFQPSGIQGSGTTFTVNGSQLSPNVQYTLVCTRRFANQSSSGTSSFSISLALCDEYRIDGGSNCTFSEGEFVYLLSNEQNVFARFHNGTLYAATENGAFVPRSTLANNGMLSVFANCFSETDPRGGSGGGCDAGNFTGYFDNADCNNLSGWALDQNNFGRTVQIDIRVDGQLVATVPANQSRPDLVGAFGNNPQAEFHGWNYAIPANASWRDGTNRSISARICGANNDLWSSPKTVNCTGGGGGAACNFSTSATVNNANVGCGGGITLNAPCSGPDCGGVSYVWSGNGLYQTSQSTNTNAPNANGSYTYYVQASKTGCTTQNNSVAVNVSGCGGGGGSSTCSAENDQCSGNSSEVRNYSVSASSSGSYTIKAFYRSHEGPGVIRWSVNGGAVQTMNVAQTSVNNYPEVTLGTATLNAGNNTVNLSSGGGFVCFRKACIEGGGGGAACNFSTSATVNNANVGCSGGITLNAPCSGPDCGGVSYVWSGNGLYQTSQSTNTNAPNANGSYTYYVQASKTGCSTQNNSVVVNVSGCGGGGGSSNCSAENDQCSGNSSEVRNYSVSASMSGIYTIKVFYRSHEGPGVIRWSVDGGAVQTLNVAQTAVNNYPEITLGTANLSSGNHTINLSSGGGFVCFRKVCIQSGARVGVAENLEEPSDIVVYPNPTSGELTLQLFLENRSDVQLYLHDLTGRRLWQSLLSKREGKVQEKLWLGEVSAGFYLLTVQTNERSWTQKVVLQK